MSEYLCFTNDSVTYTILTSAAPQAYKDFKSPIFCDMDNENLRFMVDFWRNNSSLTCTEQQIYDTFRLKMDHFDSKQERVVVSVGHRLFSTTLATLTKIPYFEAARLHHSKLSENLDRDSTSFERILSHCRHPLQHPIHKLDVPVAEFSFYGLCPKYLQLWDDGKHYDSGLQPFDRKKKQLNSMSCALNSAPDATLFVQNYFRYLGFVKNTLFFEEQDRDIDKGIGDTVYVNSESVDCSMIDILTNFHFVCESDVEITSVEQIFKHVECTLYANGTKSDIANFTPKKVEKPIKSRHALILNNGSQIENNRRNVYVEVQKNCRFDFSCDNETFAQEPNTPFVEIEGEGKSVTISMPAFLQQCLCDLEEKTSFQCEKRGNKYYITIPLQTFFSKGVFRNSQFYNLRGRFHFQIRVDGVQVSNFRLMTNAFQLSEEEYEAIITRQNEFLVEVPYKVFDEASETGRICKTLTFQKPRSIKYFLLQFIDSDSGERIVCNSAGKFNVGGEIVPFNIHTNQAHQKDVFKMKKYNPYIWIVPFFIEVRDVQPTGCLYVTSGTNMTIDIECDVKNVDIHCWMMCYRGFGINFKDSVNPDSNERDVIGFLSDVDLPLDEKPKNLFSIPPPPPQPQPYYDYRSFPVFTEQDTSEYQQE